MVVGDVKTVDNLDKGGREMLHATLGGKESSVEADVFANALKRFVIKPGDWHASLTMLQAINNSHWDGYIKHFKMALQWKRCNKETSKAY